ncbi:DEAD/DEAH box helicase family protein [Sporolactobacillus kofuensis]|uniref:DEAD/DEAH box helicase family protein n=1 Tax=Sporolactobacillus kofuensis TaxID=269672 RepID=A0ABW1WEZ3_9BACL|nr:DEAD/DEAH box helicase family protein [Sporolactobacillus kofuensis]
MVNNILNNQIDNLILSRDLDFPLIPKEIISNLNPNFKIRDYQKNAFEKFMLYYETAALNRGNQIHNLFHMATGSGKTFIMAGIILYLYTKGYNKFIFFVNSKNIINKTKMNFLDKTSMKYLFNNKIIIDGKEIVIEETETFSNLIEESKIYIKFCTIQKLHLDIAFPGENKVSKKEFKNNNIVFLSDEAHHLNSFTKSTKKSKNEAEANKKNWEQTVNGLFKSNEKNILLEFTATVSENVDIRNKYNPVTVYKYDLIKFRESGYTKEFYNLQSDYDLYERTIQAMLISQYRLKLFQTLKIKSKPVILFKHKDTQALEDFYNDFYDYFERSFTAKDIEKFRNNDNKVIKDMFEFYDNNGLTSFILLEELKLSFSKEKSLILHSKMSDKELESKLISVNNLEDSNNPYRAIFVCDMLHEGWDVLNLYDIVRLYDTRQGGRKISETTIQEAQLIGRGVRYNPFIIDNDFTNEYKRKFDSDPENQFKYLETLYYHSKNDSRYIEELRKALREIGLEDDNFTEYEYIVKQNFKEEEIFKSGAIYLNEKIKIDNSLINSIPQKFKKDYSYIDSSNKIKVLSLASENDVMEEDNSVVNTYRVTLGNIDKRIVKKALSIYPIYNFNKLKEIFNSLNSINEFIESESYLGDIDIIIQSINELNNELLYKACIKVLGDLVTNIESLKDQFYGSPTFKPVPLSSIVRDTPRKKYLGNDYGEGISQNDDTIPQDYKLLLADKDWYVYNDNYGTSEEKRFVYFFNSKVNELRKIYKKVFLIRNERNAAIFSFDGGYRFEPDYLLILINEDNQQAIQQVFIEPKGKHLRKKDKWKNDFLKSIEANYDIIDYSNEQYKILGLPFYTHDEDIKEFKDAFDELLK